MVRLLLLSTIFLSSAFAAAHDANATNLATCEADLNPAQIRTYRFLKKLQVEEDTKYPADKFVRVAAGRSVGPFAAAMQQAGSQILSLPLEMNLTTMPTGQTKSDLWQLFRTYFPAHGLGDKSVVIFVYTEKSLPVITLHTALVEYLSQHGIPADRIVMRVFASQMFIRELETKLELGMFKSEFSMRPIGVANEVRHWFHDGLTRNRHSVAQYPTIDILSEDLGDITFKAPEREAFTHLKHLLGLLK